MTKSQEQQTFLKEVLTSRNGAWLLLLWAVVTSYNLFKPFHVDDTAYLLIAKWISKHPFHPMTGIVNWRGTDEPISRIIHPHLYFYLLAAWGRMFGYSEPSMHAMQSLAALACVLLFYRLARRLAPGLALWATAIVILGPAFIVEQNVMIDVPLLAVWLLFFNTLICGVRDERQTVRYVVAAGACSAAMLVKYSSVILGITLAISLLLERRRKQAWTLLIPALTVAAWSVFNYIDYGGVHILTQSDEAPHTYERLFNFAKDWLLGIGGLCCLGFIVTVQRLIRSDARRRVAYSGVAVLFALLVFGVGSGLVTDQQSDPILAFAFLISGLLTVAAFLVAAWAIPWRTVRHSTVEPEVIAKLYVVLWVALTSCAYIKGSPFIASRHILLVLPALTVLLVQRWGTQFTPFSTRFGLAITIVISAGLCVSDWSFASFYRTEARELSQSLRGSGSIWAEGHWGWQWYAMQNGMQLVEVVRSDLKPGDSLVVPREVNHQVPRERLALQLIRSDAQPQGVVRLFCTARPVSFYQFVDTGPWTLSRNCVNHIDVYRVQATGAASGPL